jgi:hypothetical protein
VSIYKHFHESFESVLAKLDHYYSISTCNSMSTQDRIRPHWLRTVHYNISGDHPSPLTRYHDRQPKSAGQVRFSMRHILSCPITVAHCDKQINSANKMFTTQLNKQLPYPRPKKVAYSQNLNRSGIYNVQIVCCLQFIIFLAGRHLGFYGTTHAHLLVGKKHCNAFCVQLSKCPPADAHVRGAMGTKMAAG